MSGKSPSGSEITISTRRFSCRPAGVSLVGVFLEVGIGLHFWLKIVLTLLGYIPGVIHAVWIILKR
jgi:uncharacterized membrane protein YqaE (UPF0057 family)